MQATKFTFDSGYIVKTYAPEDPTVTIGIANPLIHERPVTVTIDEYYAEHYEDELLARLADAIHLGQVAIGKTSSIVKHPENLRLRQAVVQRYEPVLQDDGTLCIDVIVSAEIEISAMTEHGVCSDTLAQWFRIDTLFDIAANTLCMTTGAVTVYDSRAVKPGLRLTKHLIPILTKNQLDLVAEGILKKYIPEALSTPMPINGRQLAKRMGLSVQYTRLSSDGTILGQLFFESGSTTIFGEAEHEQQTLIVAANTILIDCSARVGTKVIREDDTIVHECIHKALHQLYFYLQRQFDHEMQCISCPVTFRAEDGDERLRFIELQPNQLTPRLRMPATTTRQMADAYIKKYGSKSYLGTRTNMIEDVIKDLAAFFGASKQAARIRMIELGYEEAIGALNYADGRYMPVYRFKNGTLQQNQTCTIGLAAAVDEYRHNPSFQKYINAGRFHYVEGHFCLNDLRYIQKPKTGSPRLTEYARQHMDECCLIFDITNGRTAYKHINGKFYRCVTGTNTQMVLSATQSSAVQSFREECVQMHNTLMSLPRSLGETIDVYLDNQKMTLEGLEESSGVPLRTIYDIRRKTEYQPSMRDMVALCIGLHLTPEQSTDLISKAGLQFKPTLDHTAYMILLRTSFNQSIYDCNEQLVAAGFAPLLRAS